MKKSETKKTHVESKLATSSPSVTDPGSRITHHASRPSRLRREPTERMWRIHELLAAGLYPNCAGLAREFELSRKTVQRDLAFMRDHFDLPIEFDYVKHGFHYTRPVDRFPGQAHMTEAELFSLLVAHKVTAQYEGLPFAKTLEAGFRKLVARLDNRQRLLITGFYEALSFRPVGVEEPDVRSMAVLATALAERRGLAFDYRKPGDPESTRREVLPYHVACIDNRFYLLAHDTARADIRTFAVSRMSAPQLTAEHFEPPKDFDPERYLRTGFAAMTGHGDYEVVIEFDAWATDIMRGRRWHPSQQVTHLPGNGSRFRLRVGCLEEIERWVLSWGTHANIVRPTELTARISRVAAELLARYTTCNQN